MIEAVGFMLVEDSNGGDCVCRLALLSIEYPVAVTAAAASDTDTVCASV